MRTGNRHAFESNNYNNDFSHVAVHVYYKYQTIY